MTVAFSDPAVQLSALSVSTRILGLLDSGRHGRLIATFSRSCYVDLEGGIVAVVGPDLLNGPLNLVLAHSPEVPMTGLPVGAAVSVRDRRLDIAGRWEIDTAPAHRWDPRLPPLTDAPRVRRGLASIQAMLDAGAPAESLARSEARPPRAANGMARLAGGLRDGDVGAVGDGAGALAGLGPGLTPSGDDVLAGTLIAAAVLGVPQAGPIRERILTSIRGRTTRISAAYLEAAADGDAGEAWHRLLASLGRRSETVDFAPARRGDETADLVAAVERVLAFGETSGADMLAGFLLAFTALLP